VLSRDAALHLAVERVMRDFFDGSPELMVAHLQSRSERAPSEREPEPSMNAVWS